MSRVTLRKLPAPRTEEDRFNPSGYEVFVRDRKVGELVWQSKGGNGWHELRDLKEQTVMAVVDDRDHLDELALKLAASQD